MTSRRTVLATVGSCLMISTAGCIEGSGGGDSERLLSLGKSTTRNGLELSVEAYERASRYSFPEVPDDLRARWGGKSLLQSKFQ